MAATYAGYAVLCLVGCALVFGVARVFPSFEPLAGLVGGALGLAAVCAFLVALNP